MPSSRRATATAGVPAWWNNPSPTPAEVPATPWAEDPEPEPADAPGLAGTPNAVDPGSDKGPTDVAPGRDHSLRRPEQSEDTATAPAGGGWTDWTDWAVELDQPDRGAATPETTPTSGQAAPPPTPRQPAPTAAPPRPAAVAAEPAGAKEVVGGQIVLARRAGWAQPSSSGGDLPWPPPTSLEGKRPRGKRWRRSKGRRTSTSRKPLLSLARSLDSWEPISITEASGFAVRFAADYLSWDEDEPQRRPAALRNYLADPNQAHLGWTGAGRQRADLVIPGRTVTLADGAVIVVEITARTVLYQRTTTGGTWSPEPAAAAAGSGDDWLPPGETTPSLAFAPASAPPPVAPGWVAGAGWWVQIAVPVHRDRDGRVVVDLELDPAALNDQ